MQSLTLSENVTLAEVLEQAETLQMDAEQTLDLVWTAVGISRDRQRVFSYSNNFADSAPECKTQFVRNFVHTDWIDGESVVQAEENTLEEGFNARFHNIEEDFDALARDVAQAFVCLGDQRNELSGLLTEIRAELNRINADVFECCDKNDTNPGFGTYNPPNVYPGIIWDPFPPTGPGVNPPDPAGPWINPGYRPGGGYLGGPVTGGTVIGTPWGPDVDPVQGYLDGVAGVNSFRGAGTPVVRSNTDRDRAIIGGMQARLLEETVFNGQDVEVWSTQAGLILTPLTPEVEAEASRTGWTNPRIEGTGRYAKWAAENNAAVVEAFGGREFKLGDFIEKFGDEKLEGGVRIKALLGDLPSGSTAKAPADFVVALAETNGKAIVSEGYATETVIGAIGLTSGDKALAEAPPSSIKSIPEKVGEGLVKIGIGSLKDFSSTNLKDTVAKLAALGVDVRPEDVAVWSATATTLIAVDAAARGRK